MIKCALRGASPRTKINLRFRLTAILGLLSRKTHTIIVRFSEEGREGRGVKWRLLEVSHFDDKDHTSLHCFQLIKYDGAAC